MWQRVMKAKENGYLRTHVVSQKTCNYSWKIQRYSQDRRWKLRGHLFSHKYQRWGGKFCFIFSNFYRSSFLHDNLLCQFVRVFRDFVLENGGLGVFSAWIHCIPWLLFVNSNILRDLCTITIYVIWPFWKNRGPMDRNLPKILPLSQNT